MFTVTKLAVLVTFIFVGLEIAHSSPVTPPVIDYNGLSETWEVVNDFFARAQNGDIQNEFEQAMAGPTLDDYQLERLKYDVEELEPSHLPKEDVELEERYKAPALQTNTDTFVAENIEVNTNNTEKEKYLKEHHLLLSIGVVLMALISVALYAAMVIWRTRLEERYGTRELLDTFDDDDYYLEREENASNNDDANDAAKFLGNIGQCAEGQA